MSSSATAFIARHPIVVLRTALAPLVAVALGCGRIASAESDPTAVTITDAAVDDSGAPVAQDASPDAMDAATADVTDESLADVIDDVEPSSPPRPLCDPTIASGFRTMRLPVTPDNSRTVAMTWMGTRALVGVMSDSLTPTSTIHSWIYDPTRDSMHAVPALPIPSTESASFFAIPGGALAFTTWYYGRVARFDEASETWTMGPDVPWPRARAWDATVFAETTQELIVWGGGMTADGPSFATENDGYAYSVATNRWRALPPAPIDGYAAHGIWTGTEMLVVAGAKAAAYDPLKDSWRPVADPTGISAMSRTPAVALATDLGPLVWGDVWIGDCGGGAPDGAFYDVKSDRWNAFPPMPADQFHDMYSDAVRPLAWWGAGRFFLFGGDACGTEAIDRGAVFDPTSGTWTPFVSSILSGVGQWNGAVAWDGCEAIIVGTNDGKLVGAIYRP